MNPRYARAVEVDAVPALDPPVLRALAVVLEGFGISAPSSSRYDDAWRRAAVLEGVESDESTDGYEAYARSPRRTLGATRA
jgi:hypothetical protein